MKYIRGIMFNGYCDSMEMILFPPSVSHKHMATSLNMDVKSAGFITMSAKTEISMESPIFGQSDSLGVKSDPNDIKYLGKNIND